MLLLKQTLAGILALLWITSNVYAQAGQSTAETYLVEKENSGWAFYLDNDALISGSPDRDYTGGFGMTLSGGRATDYLLSVDGLRTYLDAFFQTDRLYNNEPYFKLHSFEFGITLFTPNDQSSDLPLFNDHPYANLVFVANSEQTILPVSRLAYQSTLTLGILGLTVGERLQAAMHRFIDAEKPRGWDNQISDGGELTAKYTLSVQKTLYQQQLSDHLSQEFKTSAESNIGYSTDIAIGFNWRMGNIDSPWWSFNPHQAEYINLGNPVTRARHDGSNSELYMWLGGTLKYRFYNSILQGQFRDSAVTFTNNQLEHLIAEVWIGVTSEFARNYHASLFYRARTSEIKSTNARDPRWGGIILTRSY